MDERFENAVPEAVGMLGRWSIRTLLAAVPLVFAGLCLNGFEPGVRTLLPVAWFWSLGFAAAWSHAWRERWSQFPRRNRPLSAAFGEMGGIAARGLGVAALVTVISMLFGGFAGGN